MWDLRAARARLLAGRYAATREILLFYSGLAEWQGKVSGRANTLGELKEFLPSLLEIVIRTGPALLSCAARELSPEHGRALVEAYWDRRAPASPLDFFARALLQPYAAGLPAGQECPWCRQPPQVGCLRPQGEGLALDVVCSLCLRRRPFPRGRCPGCGESSEVKLPGFSAPEFPQLRLQACDTCGAYLPLVDLARDPLAIPEVDELAGLPLDLWAAEQGYHKLQPNLAGI
jgi:Protein involved in formate dehydrogenase formation